MTHNLLSINLVPRHSYTSDSLYLDGKNRAVLRSFRPQTGPAPKRDTTQRPPLTPQRLLFFIAGPLVVMLGAAQSLISVLYNIICVSLTSPKLWIFCESVKV